MHPADPTSRNDSKSSQGVVRDRRGQDQPVDRERAQQSSSRRQRGESDPPLRRDDRDNPSPKKK